MDFLIFLISTFQARGFQDLVRTSVYGGHNLPPPPGWNRVKEAAKTWRGLSYPHARLHLKSEQFFYLCKHSICNLCDDLQSWDLFYKVEGIKK